MFICFKHLKSTTRCESANNINMTVKIWQILFHLFILIHYANKYYIYICTYMYEYIYIYILYMYMYVYKSIYIYMYIYINIYIYIYIYIHSYIFIYLYLDKAKTYSPTSNVTSNVILQCYVLQKNITSFSQQRIC